MNLYSLLQEREVSRTPIRVGMVGAGKFATMFMAQIIRTPGMSLDVVCDLNPDRARKNLNTAGFQDSKIFNSPQKTYANSDVFVTDDINDVLRAGSVDVVIESTGDPVAGVSHALQSISCGIDIVMVNVEADVLAGASLAKKARDHNVIYSLAYGDQPALIVEQVDTVRSMGLEVVCAGKGTKYLPSYHQSTPDTVWNYYGLTREDAERGGMNSKMFNSFLDGTKSAIEMTAVANATGLEPPENGLSFPPCSVDELGSILRPKSEGGVLAKERYGRSDIFTSPRWLRGGTRLALGRIRSI